MDYKKPVLISTSEFLDIRELIERMNNIFYYNRGYITISELIHLQAILSKLKYHSDNLSHYGYKSINNDKVGYLI